MPGAPSSVLVPNQLEFSHPTYNRNNVGTRTLLGAKGIATRNKKLLVAPGIATRNKDATSINISRTMPNPRTICSITRLTYLFTAGTTAQFFIISTGTMVLHIVAM